MCGPGGKGRVTAQVPEACSGAPGLGRAGMGGTTEAPSYPLPIWVMLLWWTQPGPSGHHVAGLTLPQLRPSVTSDPAGAQQRLYDASLKLPWHLLTLPTSSSTPSSGLMVLPLLSSQWEHECGAGENKNCDYT